MAIERVAKNDGTGLVDLTDAGSHRKVKTLGFNHRGEVDSVNGKPCKTAIPVGDFLTWADISVALKTAATDYSRELAGALARTPH